MTDIRARLAKAMHGHYPDRGGYCTAPKCIDPPTICTHAHLVDLLFSVPGIAIIDTENEATIDRAAEAIWEASVDPPDIPDYRSHARHVAAVLISKLGISESGGYLQGWL